MTPEQVEQQQGYVILDQTLRVSQFNGRPMIQIDLVGVGNRLPYRTYIQKTNHNHRYWHYITDHAEQGFVITFHNLKIADRDRGIINADSVPAIEIAADLPEILTHLKDVWETEDRQIATPLLRELFEFTQ